MCFGQEAAHELGRGVDDGDDAAVVEAGGADDADGAHDRAVGVHVRRDDEGGAREREELVLRADEDAHALGLLGELQEAGDVALLLEVVHERAHAFEVSLGLGRLQEVSGAPHDQAVRRALAVRGPGGEAALHHGAGEPVDLLAPPLHLAGDGGVELRQGAAGGEGVHEIRGLPHGGGGLAGGRHEDAVLHMAVGEDENDKGAVGAQRHELHVADGRAVALRGEDQGGAAGEARERRPHAVERRGDVAGVLRRAHGGFEPLAVLARHGADLQEAIHKEPEACLGGHAASAHMRVAQEAHLLQVLHDVTDSGGRDLFGKRSGQAARAYRGAGLQISLDHPAKDFAGAVVHLLDQKGLRHGPGQGVLGGRRM